MRTPPQIEPSELYPVGYVKKILNLTDSQYDRALRDGDLRRQKSKYGSEQTCFHKGTDILYYHFKHKEQAELAQEIKAENMITYIVNYKVTVRADSEQRLKEVLADIEQNVFVPNLFVKGFSRKHCSVAKV